MSQMTKEEFAKVETLEILKPVWVDGKFKQPGDKVQLAGNDKVQLIGAKQAQVAEDKKGK